jgi:flagellar protein FliS
MVDNPYEKYKRMQVETASQGKLILMLYEGALKNLRMAKSAIAEKKINDAHNCLMKTQAIIGELNNTLNMEAGGGVAENLRKMYTYLLQRLLDANLKKDGNIVEEILGLLLTMKEAWEEIILKKPAALP